MRLTLRTLLAYLDDTLAPNEIKGIGEKVALSPTAQEQIARINKVTRRRRLTVPPTTGPLGRFDANDIAEYLDNCMPDEKVTELEQLCLDSDVHLAEIASCHQILTLVVCEPAMVPPKAQERMYGLVRGSKTRSRKARTPGNEATVVENEEGLPFLRGQLRWLIPIAGVLLLAALGLAVYQILPDQPVSRVVRNTDRAPNENKSENGEPKEPKKTTKVDPQQPPEVEKPNDLKKIKVPPIEKDPPLQKREVVGVYNGGPPKRPSILLVRESKESTSKGSSKEKETAKQPSKHTKPVWSRARPQDPVYTGDQLLALPGYLSDLTVNQVGLVLCGLLPEYAQDGGMYLLLESSVQLNPTLKGSRSEPEIDLDLTLERGRIFLVNRKESGSVTVRLRFEQEVWELILETAGTEVGIDLVRREPPLVTLDLFVIRGAVKEIKFPSPLGQIRIPLQAPPGPAQLFWDTIAGTQGPVRHENMETPGRWRRIVPVRQGVPADLSRMLSTSQDELSLRLNDPKKAVDIALAEATTDPKISSRLLAVYAMGAVDDLEGLLGRVADKNRDATLERAVAIYTLQRWLSRGAEQRTKLFDEKSGKGLLTEREQFSAREARIISTLLFGFTEEDLTRAETFDLLADYLVSRQVTISHLAVQYLREYFGVRRLKIPEVLTPQRFNPAGPAEDRQAAREAIKQMIETMMLPAPMPKNP